MDFIAGSIGDLNKKRIDWDGTKYKIADRFLNSTTASRMRLTPDVVLYGYRIGVFPMADPDENDEIHWYAPDPRAILPLDAFHVPKNLQKVIDRERFEVVADCEFERVIRACARRRTTWISDEVIRVYTALAEAGYAHSVECRLDGQLVGGLYGVALGAAFFGESMFHREADASKVALVHLVRRLKRGGFVLLDTQYATPHLQQFGVREISRGKYQRLLDEAVRKEAFWDLPDA